MNLDDVAVRLRSRSAYEATDLGFALGRNFWKPIYGAWLICISPIFAVATAVAVWTGNLALPLLAVWLLKPAYDRLPLFVVSRGIFGDVPGVGRTVRHTLSRWNSLTVLLDCTIRRLSPYRGFLQPIRELEHQASAQYRNRKQALLRRDVRGPAFLLLMAGLVAEQILAAAGFACALLVTAPQTITASSYLLIVRTIKWAAGFLESGELPTSFIILTMVSYFVAVSLVEVFYVSGSFGLYINRRIHLEGWDIEIAFKRLARRLGGTLRRAATVLLMGGAVAVATFAGPTGAAAQPEESPSETSNSSIEESGERDPQKVADEILEAPEFGETKEKWVWVPRNDEEEEPEERESRDLDFGDSLAGIFELLLWVAAALGVVVVGYALVRYATEGDRGFEEDDAPDSAAPVVETPEEDSREFRLPADLVETARRHWGQGAHVESLSVLYRGTIHGLAERYGIEIEPSMTARECLRVVREAGGPGNYVGRLGRAWTATVYADRPPSDADAETLFREWRRHFTGGRG